VLVRLTRTDGVVREVHIPHATGSKDNPMTEAQLTAKFMTLSRNILEREKAVEFTERLAKLEAETTISALLDLTVPKQAA
jgi:2-methylcitrate dehydratase PrpD